MITKIASLGLVAGLVGAAGTARADDYETVYVDEYGYSWHDPRLQSDIGVGIILGGGISSFTDRDMRDTMTRDVQGLWDARIALGTHTPLGIELGYVGTAAGIKTLSGQTNGTLVGTAGEAALRLNFLPHFAVDPYIFAGVGWQRYDVNNMHFATADTGMKQTEDIAEFPMGAGIAFRDTSGFTVDLRGTFRAAASNGLLVDPTSNHYADLHTWEASGALGYEF